MTSGMAEQSPAVLAIESWKTAREADLRRLDQLLARTYRHRMEHRKHPVWDFLWEYYHFRPSKCRQWSAGVGVGLEGAEMGKDVDATHWVERDGTAWLDADRICPERRDAALWILNHLKSTEKATPRFNCFGFHEWAMIYRSPERRHDRIPLRLRPDEVDRAVEAQGLCCTHYDAFRFFTPEAVPRNSSRLTPDDRSRMEQPGCLHATMDLYKWAFKFYPYIPTRLVIEGLDLAAETRRLDMEASPYDLREFGFHPVAIETAQGRAEYLRRQTMLMERARPLRRQLISAYENLTGTVPDPHKPFRFISNPVP